MVRLMENPICVEFDGCLCIYSGLQYHPGKILALKEDAREARSFGCCR